MADRELLSKSFIKLGILVFLFILSPIVITMGFKALKLYTESPNFLIAYIILFIGFCLLIFSIFLAFRTFKEIGDAFFKK
ncbi:MAG: DUF6095 family protein [Polaribacter sp.]|uniref:DUF6095 family protein n=1 Tax=Polaribacter sp. TaxID=1920175 RepID=UPI003BB07800